MSGARALDIQNNYLKYEVGDADRETHCFVSQRVVRCRDLVDMLGLVCQEKYVVSL